MCHQVINLIILFDCISFYFIGNGLYGCSIFFKVMLVIYFDCMCVVGVYYCCMFQEID